MSPQERAGKKRENFHHDAHNKFSFLVQSMDFIRFHVEAILSCFNTRVDIGVEKRERLDKSENTKKKTLDSLCLFSESFFLIYD